LNKEKNQTVQAARSLPVSRPLIALRDAKHAVHQGPVSGLTNWRVAIVWTSQTDYRAGVRAFPCWNNTVTSCGPVHSLTVAGAAPELSAF